MNFKVSTRRGKRNNFGLNAGHNRRNVASGRAGIGWQPNIEREAVRNMQTYDNQRRTEIPTYKDDGLFAIVDLNIFVESDH